MLRKLSISILLLTVLSFPEYSIAQAFRRMDDGTAAAITSAIQKRFSDSALTGLSVGIIYGGQLVYANAWGKKNDNGDDFTIHTKSLLASVSKTITGIMAMRMIDSGAIGLDVTIDNYIDGYDGTGITIRHLLSHQSGIGHYMQCPGGYDGQFDWESSVEVVQGCSICITPGSATVYSTFGTTLLGSIIEKRGLEVYNRNFRQLYNSWIRNPGGLSALTPAFDDSDPALARGYDNNGNITSDDWDDIGWKLPAGGFISDIVSLADYGRGILWNTFISREALAQMSQMQTTSGTVNQTCGSITTPYGLAFRVNGTGDDLILSHSGLNSEHGYTADFYLYPALGAGIVMLCNTSNGNNTLAGIEQDVRNIILCPGTRDFSTDIAWNSSLYYEANNINVSAALNHDSGNMVFDAGNSITLYPGFSMSPTTQKTFYAFIEGCRGANRPF
ncbi:MAG: beta-lactamase family protein [Chitinophagaceae bacterium]|nr:beta-lactamase family protein [Chitinophagaceae bacterium]